LQLNADEPNGALIFPNLRRLDFEIPHPFNSKSLYSSQNNF